MPRGDKSAYTDKQKRQAEHIEKSYEHRGIPENEAERRAWATVNKETGGGKKSGGGRGRTANTEPSRTDGKPGGKAAASHPASPTVCGSEEASGHAQAQSPCWLIHTTCPCPDIASLDMLRRPSGCLSATRVDQRRHTENNACANGR